MFFRKNNLATPSIVPYEVIVQNPDDVHETVFAHRLRFITSVRQPGLLISEIQRSGGSMLSQLLDGHPQLHVHPAELKIGRPTKYYWANLDLSQRPERWFDSLKEGKVINSVRYGYRKAQPRPDEARDPLPFIYSQELQRRIFLKLAAEHPVRSQRDVLDHYFTSYFNAWLDYQGLYRPVADVKFWAAFVPRVAMEPANCDRFFRDYPDGRLVSVIRDPASWYASAQRHNPREYGDLDIAISLWMKSANAAAENHTRYPGRVILIRFEEIIADTESAMRRLCRAAGLDFSPRMLVPTFNGMPMKANTSFSSAQAGAIMKSTLKRAEDLSRENIQRIRQLSDACYRDVLAAC